MFQPQSSALTGGSTTQEASIKKAVERKILQEQLSPLEGIARSASVLNIDYEYIPEVAIGFGMSIVTKVGPLTPKIGSTIDGAMGLGWVRSQLRRDATGRAMLDSTLTNENVSLERDASNLKLTPLVTGTPKSVSAQMCAIGLNLNLNLNPNPNSNANANANADADRSDTEKACHSLKRKLDLAASLEIKTSSHLPQRLSIEPSLLASESAASETTQSLESIHLSSVEQIDKMTEAVHSLNRLQIVSEQRDFSPEPKSERSVMGESSQPSAAEPTVRLINSAESKNGAAEKASTLTVAKSSKLAMRLEVAFAEAEACAKIFEHQRIQRMAERDIQDIESGCRRFTDPLQRQSVLEAAKEKKAAADKSLNASGPPRYALTLKKLFDCTESIEACSRGEADNREEFMKQALARLEELMVPIDKIWNGIPGKTPDLPRPGIRGKGEAPMAAEDRIKQIQVHLSAKINTVDGAQAQRVSVVKDNPVFKEILKMHADGTLPKDGSLIFFTSEGTLLYQAELKVSQRSTVARAKDVASAERHAKNTPAFIDIARLSQGIGPEGAGLWRFIGQENRIIGAAVLQPVVKDGKLVELPGAKNGRGEPMLKKEVCLTIGEIPDEISCGMAYGHLLNTLRAKKIAQEKAASNPVSTEITGISMLPTSAQLVCATEVR